jgi:hypothetical protein
LTRDARELEARVDELSARLRAVERRLSVLEGPDRIHEPSPDAGETAREEAPSPRVRVEILPLVGRTIIVLAGAFLLRAVTEHGILPRGTGTAIGMAYALLWLVLADLAAGKEKRTGAMFHGIASAIIAFPLIWEATVKFEFLTPSAGVGALLLVTALGLTVAARRGLRRLAWVITVAAAFTAPVLAVSSRALVPSVAFLLLLGFATLWLGWFRGWRGPGWLAAWAADLSILLMTVMVLAGRTEQVGQLFHPESLVTLQLSLVLIYCGSLGARALAHAEVLRPGDVAQGTAVLILGLGGAIVVTHLAGVATVRVGLVALVLAAACYAVSFAFIDRRSAGRTNFIFYTTAALFFTLAAFDVLSGPAASTFAFAAASLAAAWLGAARFRATLSLHAAVYAIAAIVTSGLIAVGLSALVGATTPSLGSIGLPALVALVFAAASAWFPVATHGRTWGRFSRAPKFLLLAVLTLGVVGLVVILGAPLLPVSADEVPDRAALAVLRTGVLALAALLLAGMGRKERFREASWLVYPVLIGTAAKVLLEDVPSGRASTLFLSLAFFGGALILAPRLIRRQTV